MNETIEFTLAELLAGIQSQSNKVYLCFVTEAMIKERLNPISFVKIDTEFFNKELYFLDPEVFQFTDYRELEYWIVPEVRSQHKFMKDYYYNYDEYGFKIPPTYLDKRTFRIDLLKFLIQKFGPDKKINFSFGAMFVQSIGGGYPYKK